MELKDKLKELRIKHNMTQEEVGEKLGFSAQTVSKWERGISSPDISLLPKIATMFRCSIDSLFNMQSCWNEEHEKELLEKLEKLRIEGKFEEVYLACIEEIDLNPDNFAFYPKLISVVYKNKMFDRDHVSRVLQVVSYAEKYCRDKNLLYELIIGALMICHNAENEEHKKLAKVFYEKLPRLQYCREVRANFALYAEELRTQLCHNVLILLSFAHQGCSMLAQMDMPTEEKLYFQIKSAEIFEIITEGKYGGVLDAELILAYKNIVISLITLGRQEETREYMERIFALTERRMSANKEELTLYKISESELPDPKGTDKFIMDLLKNMAKSKHFNEWSERLSATAERYEKYYETKN
ncbi:MAG: helix-turn-helix transcriptional regulator [Clostridia bacterium]|nr:helix-turn-helix transcriptional regulator [Clostridia bacterium]